MYFPPFPSHGSAGALKALLDTAFDGLPIRLIKEVQRGLAKQFTCGVTQLLRAESVHGYDCPARIHDEIHRGIALKGGSPLFFNFLPSLLGLLPLVDVLEADQGVQGGLTVSGSRHGQSFLDQEPTILAIGASQTRFSLEGLPGRQYSAPLVDKSGQIVRVDGGLPARTAELL